MSRDALVGNWSAATRHRAARHGLLMGVPVVIVAAALAWRLAGAAGAAVATTGTVALIAALVWWRARRFDRRWLVAALDASRRDVEDSADLAFADPATLGPLQRLQRSRVLDRVEASPVAALIPAPEPRVAAGLVVAAVVVAAAIVAWPRAEEAPFGPAAEGLPALPGVPRLVAQRLVVVPPGYTGLPARVLGTLDARVPAGARLSWDLRFAPDPAAAALEAVAAKPLALVRSGDGWRTNYRADRPLLYRVVARGAERAGVPPLHRIEIVPDAAPQVRLAAPGETLNMLNGGQRSWSLAFVATDDHGVAPRAQLRLVVAQGEGENVRFSERVLVLAGSGPARARRFAAQLDLAALGFTDPGDLVAQLTVADTRQPGPQAVRGPSVILRRAAPRAPEGSGLEAAARRVMPAYFRSQRQIIIDAEALLKERLRLAPDRFLARSDAIGVDQRLLRLRYGQFLGEETGGGASIAMPTNDEEEGTAAAVAEADTHTDDDGHDHAASPNRAGSADAVLETYGHTHDESEAATLLDPQTRATLRQALDSMWQSELQLRQGDPRAALPHAHRALRFIKQVQQATRIFLARTGSQTPPLDFSRRLTGGRGALAGGRLAPAAGPPVDATAGAIWRALDTARQGPALDALERWAAAHRAQVPDPLALAGAIDALRRQPRCVRCLADVRAALWPALPRPVAGLVRRNAGDAAGRRYLDQLP